MFEKRTHSLRRLRISKQAVALFTAAAFFTTNVHAYPVRMTGTFPEKTAGKALIPHELRLPESLGTVQEIYEHPGQGPVVILIQDAHAVPDAQRGIQKLIMHLKGQYGVDAVALEGASRTLDPQIFRSFPDPALLKKILEEYQKNGEIPGGVSAAILDRGAGSYHGIEDWELFEEGLNLFLQSMNREAPNLRKIEVLRKQTEDAKQKIYSRKLLQLDRSLQRFYHDPSSFSDVFKTFAAVKKPHEGSELALLFETIMKTGEINTRVRWELRRIVKNIRVCLFSRRLTSEGRAMWNELHAKEQAFQTSRLDASEFGLFLYALVPHDILICG